MKPEIILILTILIVAVFLLVSKYKHPEGAALNNPPIGGTRALPSLQGAGHEICAAI
jgi:hypothetical protein